MYRNTPYQLKILKNFLPKPNHHWGGRHKNAINMTPNNKHIENIERIKIRIDIA